MHPILEIGLADTIDFSKSPSPQQQRRYQPHLVSAGPGRPHRRTVRLMASSPIRPSSPTTHEISPPRRRRRSSPKAKPVVGPGASAGKAVQQDTDEGENANPPRLSLTRLKQHESHERIRHGASEILRLSEGFPGYPGQSAGGGLHSANNQPLPSDSDLRHMAQLSHNIASDIFDIFTLRNGDHSAADSRRRHVRSITTDHANVMREGAKGEVGELCCHKCHRTDTPKWRLGPDGPMTLCNVCGLIYAKKRQNQDVIMSNSSRMN